MGSYLMKIYKLKLCYWIKALLYGLAISILFYNMLYAAHFSILAKGGIASFSMNDVNNMIKYWHDMHAEYDQPIQKNEVKEILKGNIYGIDAMYHYNKKIRFGLRSLYLKTEPGSYEYHTEQNLDMGIFGNVYSLEEINYNCQASIIPVMIGAEYYKNIGALNISASLFLGLTKSYFNYSRKRDLVSDYDLTAETNWGFVDSDPIHEEYEVDASGSGKALNLSFCAEYNIVSFIAAGIEIGYLFANIPVYKVDRDVDINNDGVIDDRDIERGYRVFAEDEESGRHILEGDFSGFNLTFLIKIII